MFWPDTDLKTKLWEDLKNPPIEFESSTNKKESVNLDEEGIVNGIREIERRFENELDEQEKLWSPSSSEGLA